MAKTALFNVVTVCAAGATGVVIARSLGPGARGQYAAVITWFGLAYSVGQLGQTSATTYFVSREPKRAADYVATSRNIMLAGGALVLLAGLLVTPLLSGGDPQEEWGFRLIFVTCLPWLFGAAYTSALLATNASLWNLVSISQPVTYVAVISVLYFVRHLDLVTALAALSVTVLAQAVLAYLFCRGRGLTGGASRVSLGKPMAWYGASQLTSVVLTLLSVRLDQLVLSVAASPVALGQYSVALSLTGLAVPIVSAVGSIAFPRIASRTLSAEGTARLQRRAIFAALAVGLGVMGAISAAAGWLVPIVYGPNFRDAVPLVWFLAPSGVFVSGALVCGELLRGHGRPLDVARAYGVGMLLAAGLLLVLLPTVGTVGAAIASSVAAGGVLLTMLRFLSKVTLADGTGNEYAVPRSEADSWADAAPRQEV